MPRYSPFTIQMQITRLFEQGQSFFAVPKIQDWLRERNENPADYEVRFHKRVPPPGLKAAFVIEIELVRVDGQPVDPWLQTEINRHT